MSRWTRPKDLVTYCLVLSGCLTVVGGCVSDQVGDGSRVSTYQRRLAEAGPQQRLNERELPSAEPLGLLKPAENAEPTVPSLAVTVDPNTGQRSATLTIEQALARALANSPEIRVVSFDPEITRQELAKAAGDFDPVSFSRYNYDRQDNPVNSFFDPGESEDRLYESGIKQRTILGSEWSASYGLRRVWDDLSYHTLSTRYEPMVVFELRQPLLRDAGTQVNLAGVDIARLNYEAAMLSFRERAEAVCAAVITAYWRLVQARRDVEIQRELVDQTNETLKKVEGRRDIDATDVQTKQAFAYARAREATLLVLARQTMDVQDALVRLIADPHVNTASDLTILPASEPQAVQEIPEPVVMTDRTLATAMRRNPVIQRAQLGIRVAEINVQVAQNQELPRLDFVGSARSRSLSEDLYDAQDQIDDGQYTSYAVGLVLEYPLGNRSRHAETLRRQWERRKATAILHNAADQVGTEVRAKARRVTTSFEELRVQRQAVQAARVALSALEESEPIREKLTPEFLLVKLQAQDTYAQARRAEVAALVEFSIALAELAQAAGTILDLRMVESSLSSVVEKLPDVEPAKPEFDWKTEREPPWEMSPSF